ncbi:MAG: rhamnulokinase family protein [Planctomycetota bacterium]
MTRSRGSSRAPRHALAIDLGASSGRVIAAAYEGDRVTLREIYRFPNAPVRTMPGSPSDRLYWDVLAIWSHVVRGLGLAVKELGADTIDSIGVDSWAVDYALLGPSGRLIHHPACYRDRRTERPFRELRERLTDNWLYGATGIQFQPFNTLYQLAADAADPDRPLDRAQTMLLIPDLIAYWLTGTRSTERTNASHTQLFDAASDTWRLDIAEAAGIPASVLPPIRGPGTPLGTVLRGVAEATGLNPQTRVIAVATHDTASAFIGTPIADARTDAIISSGTWSLVGVEIEEPIRTEDARLANCSNEAGPRGTTRFLKNVVGMWLIQQCQHAWALDGRAYDAAEITRLATTAPSRTSLIDVDDPAFTAPGDMPRRIHDWFTMRGESPPETEADLARCIFESVAAKTVATLGQIERLTGTAIERIHIVGGGANNALLNQLIADASDRPVMAGPAEATAMGNALMQLVGMGHLEDIAQARQLARRSTAFTEFEPAASHTRNDPVTAP